jgi:hypothetical protein
MTSCHRQIRLRRKIPTCQGVARSAKTAARKNDQARSSKVTGDDPRPNLQYALRSAICLSSLGLRNSFVIGYLVLSHSRRFATLVKCPG